MTVPDSLTYGVVVKIGVYIRAVATISLNSVVCDCECSNRMTVPCSEIILIGPEVALHVLGVGTLSASVKVLSLSGTANFQVGSLYGHAELHVARVAKEPGPEKMCVKNLSH